MKSSSTHLETLEFVSQIISLDAIATRESLGKQTRPVDQQVLGRPTLILWDSMFHMTLAP